MRRPPCGLSRVWARRRDPCFFLLRAVMYLHVTLSPPTNLPGYCPAICPNLFHFVVGLAWPMWGGRHSGRANGFRPTRGDSSGTCHVKDNGATLPAGFWFFPYRKTLPLALGYEWWYYMLFFAHLKLTPRWQLPVVGLLSGAGTIIKPLSQRAESAPGAILSCGERSRTRQRLPRDGAAPPPFRRR